MKKIAVIGTGGINSWVVKYLKELTDLFDKQKLIYVKLFDKDEIEEKNLLRGNQNFEVEDLMLQKGEVLGKRYDFDYEITFITEDNLSLLSNFNDIIVGVDNNKTRRLLYEYALKNKQYLLDLRAQGTQMMYTVLDHRKDMKYYDDKYFSNKKLMEKKGSCQLTNDITNDHIENANKTIAYLGIYCLYLKHLRGEQLASNEWKFVY